MTRDKDITQDEAADLVEKMIEFSPYNKHRWARMALAIASRAIRRGRHLTETEQLQNLQKAMLEP